MVIHSKMILNSIFILIVFYFSEVYGVLREGYGVYDINFNSSELCRGPKAINMTSLWLTVEKNNNEYYTVGNITFYAPHTVLTELRISAYEIKGAKKNQLVNYKIENPCKRPGIGNLIRNYFKTNNCIVQKGNYVFKVNVVELTKYVFGPSYFYGEYTMKGVLLSPKGNIVCILSKVEVLPP